MAQNVADTVPEEMENLVKLTRGMSDLPFGFDTPEDNQDFCFGKRDGMATAN